MRLNTREKEVIVTSVRLTDPDAKIFLFGSRADENKKGGDIDLLIQSKIIGFKEKQIIRLAIQKALGEQKIDLVICPDLETSTDPFVCLIKEKAIQI